MANQNSMPTLHTGPWGSTTGGGLMICAYTHSLTLRVRGLHIATWPYLNPSLLQLVAKETQLPLHLITATDLIDKLALKSIHICIHLWMCVHVILVYTVCLIQSHDLLTDCMMQSWIWLKWCHFWSDLHLWTALCPVRGERVVNVTSVYHSHKQLALL